MCLILVEEIQFHHPTGTFTHTQSCLTDTRIKVRETKSEIPKEWDVVCETACVGTTLTFLFFGVQLCDTDGEAVHALLQGVDPERKGVCFIEELSKQVLCIFT